MNTLQRRRLLKIVLVITLMISGIGLILLSLNKQIQLFYTPSEIKQGQAPTAQVIRVGGLVKNGSIQRAADKSLKIAFSITDTRSELRVHYQGILPDLFKEGQGVVVLGKLNSAGQLQASQVLAKHDENYRPPEVDEALKRAYRQQELNNAS